MKYFSFLALLVSITLFVFGCSPNIVHRASGNKFIVVFDEGGDIVLYDRQVNQFRKEKVKVEYRGFAASAATMYLSLEGVCVHPTASLHFHGSIPYPGETKAFGDQLMAKHYNLKLREWYYKNAVHLILITKGLTGQELHDDFGYDLCDV